MHLEGTYTFGAPLQAVWEALLDPSVIAQALPGGETMQQVGENEYEAVMNVRVGPVQGRFEGRIELLDVEPLQGYRMKVTGQGAPGFVNGEGTLALEAAQGDAGGETVLLRYAGDVQVGGRIAGISQRLVESSAKSLTRQGLQELDRQIQAKLAPAPVAAPAAAAALPEPASPATEQAVPQQLTPAASAPTPEAAQPDASAPAWQPVTPRRSSATPPPSQLSTSRVLLTTARDVANDLAADYISPAQQERLVWATVGALGMLLFVVLVRLVQRR